MATWDGPYLLGQFNRMAGRPQADQITNTTKYTWLSEAQNEVIADIASRQPEVLFAPLQQLYTTDNQRFTFGTNPDGTPIFPMGKVMIYPSPSAVPDCPWNVGYDYLPEGTSILIPNNGSYAGQLYWRGIMPWPDISDTQPSVLQPPSARELITFTAVKNFGQAGNINPDMAVQMNDLIARSFPRWMLIYRTQFVNGGGLGPLVSNPVYGPYTYAANLPSTSLAAFY